jgi:hypothetical protein
MGQKPRESIHGKKNSGDNDLDSLPYPLASTHRHVHNGRRRRSMSTKTIQPEYLSLYRQAFAEFGAHALWNFRNLEPPTAEDTLVVARALRTEGDLVARRLAERIEQSCHATVS